jgi:hypothetical protein
MINNTNSNINLSPIYDLPLLKQILNKFLIDISSENIVNKFSEIELDNNNSLSRKKATKFSNTIITSSNKIIYTNKSQLNLNLLNKNQSNLNISNSENLFKNMNKNLTKINLNESNLIFMNEQQYIRLISPFNFKLASINNHIYTFTNKSYKQINKILNNLYIICKSAFLNMSSIISKPIILINPNLIKITLFYY